MQNLRKAILRLPLGSARDEGAREHGALGAALSFALAAAIAMMPAAIGVRVAVGAVVLALVLWRAARTRPVRRVPRAWIAVDASGLHRVDEGGTREIVRWGAPFGLTVLSDRARKRALFA